MNKLFIDYNIFSKLPSKNIWVHVNTAKIIDTLFKKFNKYKNIIKF